MNRINTKKTFIEKYKQYHIFKITDAHGQTFFNAEHPHPEEGLITLAASSTSEICRLINNQIKVIQSFRKEKILR